MPLEESSSPATPATEYITKVAVKLPEFWTKEPDLWFIQAEAAFRNAVPRILLSPTKFNHVETPSEDLDFGTWPDHEFS